MLEPSTGANMSLRETVNRTTHPFITRVEWEPENDKPNLKPAFDELVANDVNLRIENLGGEYWMSISRDGEDRQIVVFAVEGGKIVGRTDAEYA